MHKAAVWVSSLFALALAAVVVADMIWGEDGEGSGWWRLMTGGVAALILIFVYLWNSWAGRPASLVMAVILVILLIVGTVLTFWTIAAIVWGLIAVALVMMAEIQSGRTAS